MQPQYGTTGEHVAYVSVGEPHQRFGQPRRRSAALCAGALGVALVACLTYRGKGGGGAVALAQRGDYKPRGADKLAARLAQAEVRSEVVRGAGAALPRVAKSALTSLLSSITNKLEVDCAQAGAYTMLQSTFAGLAANLTAHNSSIYSEDGTRAKAAREAKVAWLSSQASFRTAESSHASATAAATYAKGMYDQYATAKEAGLAEYNKALVPITAEKEELTMAIPVLKMVQKMVDDIIAERLAGAAAAKSGVQQLHMAPVSAGQRVKLASLADRTVVPKKDAALRAMAVSMKTMLDQPAGDHLDVQVIKKLPPKIIASMEAREEEIAATTQKMKADIVEDKALLDEWQTKLVDLSEEADKTANAMNTANLQRQQLAGIQEVKEAAYLDYHVGFVEEAAKLAQQLHAIKTISTKIDAAIAQCSGGAAA